MSQQIPTLDLTGATTNQTATVSWAQQNIHSSQQQWVTGRRPYLELVNLSACTIAVSLPRGGDNMPLPAGAWHVYPLSVEETGYTYTVLNAQQNAAANKVYGWYYAAYEEPPKTGQVVNQSQALAAPAQLSTQIVTALAGASAGLLITLGPSATASSFLIQSVTAGFAAQTGTFGIGKPLNLGISKTGGGDLWHAYLQEQAGTVFYPLNLAIPNTTPSSTTVVISLSNFAGGATVFTANTVLSVIASIG